MTRHTSQSLRFHHLALSLGCALGALLGSVPAAAQWHSAPSLPQSTSGLGACADDAGSVFALGGIVNQNQTTNAAYMFDGTAWSTIPSLLTPKARPTVVWSNGFVYVVGGYNSGDTNTLSSMDRLDTTGDRSGWQWEQMSTASLPSPRHSAAGVVDSRGRIWVIGGADSAGAPTSTAFIFDPARPQLGWEIGPELNEARMFCGAAMDRDGRIYCIGGAISGQHLSTAERFDPRQPQNGWEYVAEIPGQAPQVSLATTGRDGGIYIAGGWSGYSCMNRTLRYDPDLNVWAVSFNMATSRNSVALASAADGYIYAIGGDCVTSTAAVERLFPPPMCPADIDRNGFINGDDYDYFAESFENGCP